MSKAFSFLRYLGDLFLDFIFPPHCLICGYLGDWFCDTCRQQLTKDPVYDCLVCVGQQHQDAICDACQVTSGLAGVVIACNYDRLIQRVIHSFKYKDARVLQFALTEVFWQVFVQSSLARLSPEQLIIFPVPLHPHKQTQRGYNQCELLARQLIERLPGSYLGQGLIRQLDTSSQMQLTRQERLYNLEGAFAYTGQSLAGRTVVLLDDVCTTGSTLLECSRALLPAQPDQIWGLVLAHGR